MISPCFLTVIVLILLLCELGFCASVARYDGPGGRRLQGSELEITPSDSYVFSMSRRQYTFRQSEELPGQLTSQNKPLGYAEIKKARIAKQNEILIESITLRVATSLTKEEALNYMKLNPSRGRLSSCSTWLRHFKPENKYEDPDYQWNWHTWSRWVEDAKHAYIVITYDFSFDEKPGRGWPDMERWFILVGDNPLSVYKPYEGWNPHRSLPKDLPKHGWWKRGISSGGNGTDDVNEGGCPVEMQA